MKIFSGFQNKQNTNNILENSKGKKNRPHISTKLSSREIRNRINELKPKKTNNQDETIVKDDQKKTTKNSSAVDPEITAEKLRVILGKGSFAFSNKTKSVLNKILNKH